LIFSPGGLVAGPGKHVTMCQNMLPFETNEMRRFGFSLTYFRYLMLRWWQLISFQKAEGVIFLSNYALNKVTKNRHGVFEKIIIIPHGVNDSFFLKPRIISENKIKSKKESIRVLYVSIINFYKHQWHVAEAVSLLKKAGFPIFLDLVGPAHPKALKRLIKTLGCIDNSESYINYRGPVNYKVLPDVYKKADLFVFASSCENMPSILLEAMASGLPIACSNRGPMPEILGDAGVYFDPEQPKEIASAIQLLINSPILREAKAYLAYERAKSFSWEKCGSETFSFLAETAKSD